MGLERPAMIVTAALLLVGSQPVVADAVSLVEVRRREGELWRQGPQGFRALIDTGIIPRGGRRP